MSALDSSQSRSYAWTLSNGYSHVDGPGSAENAHLLASHAEACLVGRL